MDGRGWGGVLQDQVKGADQRRREQGVGCSVGVWKGRVEKEEA